MKSEISRSGTRQVTWKAFVCVPSPAKRGPLLRSLRPRHSCIHAHQKDRMGALLMRSLPIGLVATLALTSCIASPPIELSAAKTPADAVLVEIGDLIPDIARDIRYASVHNFVGARVDGYEAPKCYLHRQAAEALARVESQLREEGMRLKIFDCYRPVRAVKHFVRWAEDVNDERTKSAY